MSKFPRILDYNEGAHYNDIVLFFPLFLTLIQSLRAIVVSVWLLTRHKVVVGSIFLFALGLHNIKAKQEQPEFPCSTCFVSQTSLLCSLSLFFS